MFQKITKTSLILLISAFFCKEICLFWQKQYLLFSIQFCSSDRASEIRLPDCFKLAINQKNDNVTICQHDVIINFFLLPCFSCQVQVLVQVSCQHHYWFWSYGNFRLYGIDKNSHSRSKETPLAGIMIGIPDFTFYPKRTHINYTHFD